MIISYQLCIIVWSGHEQSLLNSGILVEVDAADEQSIRHPIAIPDIHFVFPPNDIHPRQHHFAHLARPNHLHFQFAGHPTQHLSHLSVFRSSATRLNSIHGQVKLSSGLGTIVLKNIPYNFLRASHSSLYLRVGQTRQALLCS